MREHNNARARLPCAPANLVRHLETSMKTGLGLKEIHESFGIPFLNVLVSYLRKAYYARLSSGQPLICIFLHVFH